MIVLENGVLNEGEREIFDKVYSRHELMSDILDICREKIRQGDSEVKIKVSDEDLRVLGDDITSALHLLCKSLATSCKKKVIAQVEGNEFVFCIVL